MAEQLNILNSGQVIATALHTEVQRSYLEYAMSVIVGRALPDVRDGLKPVHRRILYAMHELGLTPDRPYRKCARVVGDVLGKYHPHGDQAVYDALVRMVQTFSSRYPLLEGHGNFGSVDDDPPAAMRYTETRLAAVGNEGLLSEIGEATVDFIGNFDNSQQEPIVLPAQLPFLLLNGCSGIAVGMATNVPPHNLGELVDGLIALIDRPELPDNELFRLIPAPDFPTGGEILDTSGIFEAYRTGRGSIPIRGVAKLEEINLGRGRHRRLAIIVTELPFQVNKAGWIEKVAELVNQGKIDGIADLRDESDREGMRVVIEMRREAQPAQILEKLYRLTPLQMNFGVIMLAIADGQPRQMSLRELLQQFLSFREETLTRQYRYELEKAEARAHLLEGMLSALENMDGVIEILRRSPDGSTAKLQMQERFGFSDRQASAILAMPLSRLTGMERQKIQDEYQQLNNRMEELDRLLNNRKELLKSLKKDLRTLKRKFADDRRTRLVSAAEQASAQAELAQFGGDEEAAEQEVVLEFTQKGYVRRFTPKAYQKRQEKQETPVTQTLTELEDFPVQTETANTGHSLLMLTKDGKAYSASIAAIQATARQSKGTPLVTLLPATAQTDPEAIVSQLILPSAPEDLEGLDLVLLTCEGRIKRMPLSEFTNLTARGITALKLKENDELRFVRLTQAGEQLILATSTGRLLRLEVNDEQIPLMGRSAQGQQAMRLHKNEQLVDCITALQEDDLLLMTAQGDAKRIPVSTLKLMSRGGLGVQAIQFSSRSDTLAAVGLALPNGEVTVLTSDDRLAKLPIDKVPLLKRSDAGDPVLKLSKSEKVVRLFENEAIEPEEDAAGKSA
ncbi:DNA gyrase subunit A [Leptolyngbya sp. FACHB-711]|uniref:DNA gyrase subunit A n=1 Tax=unclassified Leptolyngbya TaxID=2650499 RepID=UPI001682F0FF|nr:DNA gyrase subunit A [Leptolyngbya sp. FACHB-711]MBD1849382.1 DNA gyrase subunit A [Cyanobacteria bacterium FACHB-502]MBD2026224.1 DNA gyrase subunit A [Leptolyngbya sp. FACHB-711]